jgi:hypothetical protein
MALVVVGSFALVGWLAALLLPRGSERSRQEAASPREA